MSVRLIYLITITATIVILSSLISAEECHGVGKPCLYGHKAGTDCCVLVSGVTGVTVELYPSWAPWFLCFLIIFFLILCTGICAYWRSRNRRFIWSTLNPPYSLNANISTATTLEPVMTGSGSTHVGGYNPAESFFWNFRDRNSRDGFAFVSPRAVTLVSNWPGSNFCGEDQGFFTRKNERISQCSTSSIILPPTYSEAVLAVRSINTSPFFRLPPPVYSSREVVYPQDSPSCPRSLVRSKPVVVAEDREEPRDCPPPYDAANQQLQQL